MQRMVPSMSTPSKSEATIPAADPSPVNSQSYAHENYVQLKLKTDETTQLQAVLAAYQVTGILQKELPQTRWDFRGFIALHCHVPNFEQYSRLTDVSCINSQARILCLNTMKLTKQLITCRQDVDIAVGSTRFETIDAIEKALLSRGSEYFQRLLSPSKLWKVNYVNGGAKVRLDIYWTIMHNIGKGFYNGCKIEWKNGPQQFSECPPFAIPVMTASASIGIKLVAHLERDHEKDFQDMFFLLWLHEIDRDVGLPWYQSQSDLDVRKMVMELKNHGIEYLKGNEILDHPGHFWNNLTLIGNLEEG